MDVTRSLALPRGDGFELVVESSTLTIEAGPDRGEVFELRGRSLVLGRESSVELPLRDPAVSRRHARVYREAGSWWVEDLGSKSGTRLAGRQVDRAELGGGDLLELGGTSLRFQVEEERQKVLPATGESLGSLRARSPQMRRVFGLVRRVAPLDLSVLLQGESGTGKEGLARALHDFGARPRGPFRVVDCTLLDREHLRSELFGHVRGAFTGATENREGAFQLSHGGTLFLDEVGELPLELQPTLLRVLETGQVQPLGASRSDQVDVRLVAATHRDLEAMVVAGSFREDLFYRLAAISVPIPPLRERRGDASYLAECFLPEGKQLSPESRASIEAQTWPGNVRQLRNAIQRAVALAEGDWIEVEDLGLGEARGLTVGKGPTTRAQVANPAPESGRSGPPPPPGLTPPELAERTQILESLEACRWSRTAAADRLGISRITLWRRMKRYQLLEDPGSSQR